MKNLICLSLFLANAQSWQRAVFQDVTLEYRLAGAGDPVVFIHGGVFADGLEPLSSAPIVVDKHRVLAWRRVGYGHSGPAAGNAAIGSQAAQLARLMQRLDLARAHIVGHSSGGLVALQFALDYPAATQSLVLLEPALSIPGVASPGIARAVRLYQGGDRAGAIDAFMQAVAGSHWREPVEREIPLGISQALTDAPAFFEQELPAVRAWQFGDIEARRVRVPVLAVTGGNSGTVSANWPTRQAFLMKHLPEAEAYVLDGASHMLALEEPHTLAARLRQFFAKHPIASARPTQTLELNPPVGSPVGDSREPNPDLVRVTPSGHQFWRSHEKAGPLRRRGLGPGSNSLHLGARNARRLRRRRLWCL